MKRVDRSIAWMLRIAVRGYQLVISPILPMSCRWEPTCSRYAAEALARHGAWTGTALAVGRILRCHPWGGCGFDPVPERPAGLKAPRR